MMVQFFDRQERSNPLNGTTIADFSELRRVLLREHNRPPFFAELIGENGFKLLLGLGNTEGCVQFSAADGSPPYWMAVTNDGGDSQGEFAFLIGGTVSPVPRRYSLHYEQVLDIAAAFMQTGERKPDVRWEEI